MAGGKGSGKGAAPKRYAATIVADEEVFARLEHLHLDLMPRRVLRGDGRLALDALLLAEQIEPLVAAGVTVTLRHLIEPGFPQELVMSEEQAKALLEPLEKFRGKGAKR